MSLLTNKQNVLIPANDKSFLNSNYTELVILLVVFVPFFLSGINNFNYISNYIIAEES